METATTTATTTTTTTTTATTTTSPPKFSRYRSVRQKHHQSAGSGTSGAHAVEPRGRVGAGHATAPASTEPLPSRYRPRNNTPTSGSSSQTAAARRRWDEEEEEEEQEGGGGGGGNGGGGGGNGDDDDLVAAFSGLSPMEAAREEARMILEGEFDRLQMLKQRHRAHGHQQMADVRRQQHQQPPRRTTPTGREENGYITRSPSRRHPPPVCRSTPPDSGRAAALAQPVQPSRTGTLLRRPDAGRGRGGNDYRDPNGPPASVPYDAQPPAIIPLPQIDAPNLNRPAFDAPVSAINAVERRATVAYKHSTITLPVAPTTTVKDLLVSASKAMAESGIDPHTAILLEDYAPLGLERPLRRYERIRDVMHGWATDGQNRLVIMPASECAAVGLERGSAPVHRPAGLTVRLYHSARPGHWAKKWVRLREDGQMCVSSKESFVDSSSTTNICHLSDFDLYTPTARQRKEVRAPKKICFAVKSQEKPSAFLSGQNFVHFFASSDQSVANDWYAAVWGWRSWYLVDVLGERAAEQTRKQAVFLNDQGPARPSLDNNPRNHAAAYHHPGSNKPNKPLLDLSELRLGGGGMDNRDPFNSNANRGTSADMRRHQSVKDNRSSSRHRGVNGSSIHRHPTIGAGTGAGEARPPPPPTSFPRRLVLEATNVDPSVVPRAAVAAAAAVAEPSISAEDEAFTGRGLLARHASTRSQRRGASRGAGRRVQAAAAAVQDGQPLLDLTKQSEFADGSLLRSLEARKQLPFHSGGGGGGTKKGPSWTDFD